MDFTAVDLEVEFIDGGLAIEPATKSCSDEERRTARGGHRTPLDPTTPLLNWLRA